MKYIENLVFGLLLVNVLLITLAPVPTLTGLSCIVFAAYIVFKAVRREIALNTVDLGLFVWVFTVLLSCLFSINSRVSFAYFEKLILKPLILYLAIRTCVVSSKRLLTLVRTLLFSYVASGLVGLKNIRNGIRFIGITTSPTRYGKMLDLAAVFSISVSLAETNLIVRLGAFLGFILLFFSLILTQTRGAWIGTGTALLILAFFITKLSSRKKEILFASLATCILLIGILAIAANKGQLNYLTVRFKSVLQPKETLEKDISLRQRFLFYKTAMVLIKEKPLIGWGFGRKTPELIDKELGQGWFEKRGLHPFWNHAHDVFLELAVESGFAGLAGFMFFIFSLIFQSIRGIKNTACDKQMRILKMGLLLSLVALLIHGIVTNFIQTPIIYMFFVHTSLLNGEVGEYR